MAPTADDIVSIHTSVCGRIEFSYNVKHQILIDSNVCNLTRGKLKIGVEQVRCTKQHSNLLIPLRIDPDIAQTKKHQIASIVKKTVEDNVSSYFSAAKQCTPSKFSYHTIAILSNKSFLLAVC